MLDEKPSCLCVWADLCGRPFYCAPDMDGGSKVKGFTEVDRTNR